MFFLSCFNVLASDLCKVTQAYYNNYDPEFFARNNNLLRSSESQEEVYCGQKIIIHGRLLDRNCIPVPDAKIYIWQAACDGKYRYSPMRNNLDKNLIKIDARQSFVGNGTASTDSNGEFVFLTVLPGAVHGLPSHINVRAEHRLFGKIETRIALDNLNLVTKETLANNIIANQGQLVMLKKLQDTFANKSDIYHFDIVLPASGLKKMDHNR